MKKIYIKGEQEISNFLEELDDQFILISITSPDKEFAVIPENSYCRGTLRLKFNELEHPVYGFKLFTDAQAGSIGEFVVAHKDVDIIVCQCEAGISRSAGVAAALTKYYNQDDKPIFSSGEYIPNLLVYRKLLAALSIPVDDDKIKALISLSISSYQNRYFPTEDKL